MAGSNLIYLPFGILPSIVWLLFYLREDVRPEPKKMVMKVFFLGMVFAFPAAFFECLPFFEEKKLICLLPSFFEKIPLIGSVLYSFFGIALIEEFTKYLNVRLTALKSPELDEPVDLMLYMIISGLGFAATENILLAFSKERYFEILLGRFFSATFLHALCSAILGFFSAMAYSKIIKKKFFLISGFSAAIFLHGLYNFSIIEIEGNSRILAITSILILSAVIVKISFQRLKKLKSICKPDGRFF